MVIQQPSNQIKFTNVSIVRLKKGKKRFELACYKNKLLEYRSGAETDLDNVLQVPTIFLSVQKAQTAPSAELVKAFGKDTPLDEIRQEILLKGEVQVGERERKEILERVEREVLDIVSSRLVDPTTKRIYTPGMISKALDQLSSASGQHQQANKDKEQHQDCEANGGSDDEGRTRPAQQRKPLWTGVVPHKSAKNQALDAMKALIAWQPIPVMRARMRLRVTCPISMLKQSVKTGAGSGGAAAAAAGKDKDGHGLSGGAKAPKKGKAKGRAAKHDESDEEGGISEAEPVTRAPTNVKDKILSFIESVESQEMGGDEWEVVGFAEPGAFKGLNEFVGNETRGRGRVEVLDMAVTHEDD